MSYTTVFLLTACYLAGTGNAFQQSSSSIFGRRTGYLTTPTRLSSPTVLQQSFLNEDLASSSRRPRDQVSALSAVSIGQFDDTMSVAGSTREDDQNSDWSNLSKVMTTALMITGTTVGAGALVLPEIASQPGLAVSTGLFLVAYIVNLVSGILIAEVAIKQHESSGDDVPSSFKEFADANLGSVTPAAGTIVSSISIFNNACVLAFGLSRAGAVLSSVTGGQDPLVAMIGFASIIGVLAATQSGETMSKIASATVMALFVSFFGLLVPGLANVDAPVTAFLAPGTADSVMAGISQAAPIIFTTTVYQNIVPSVTKILDYNRAQTVAAIAIGSFLPLCLYLAWCFACIGGGVSVGGGGALITAFSLAAVTGSSIGCTLSLSEEVDSFLPSSSSSSATDSKKNVQPAAVMASIAVPLAAAIWFTTCDCGQDMAAVPLKIAGSYASPLLYGVIPATMAWTQREKLCDLPNVAPGGALTLGALGIASMGLMLQELSIDVGQMILPFTTTL